jgi:glycosyltransferase involved in cell wall biosynthesis
LRQGARFARELRRRGIDVVHTHDRYSNIFAVPWARSAGVPAIASRRWWFRPDQRLHMIANRVAYTLANLVLANSPRVATLLVERERVPARKVRVVPNFLDEAAFAPPPPEWRQAHAARVDFRNGGTIVGVVASLQPVKDQATLLRAAALLIADGVDLDVMLVGRDGGTRNALERLGAELDLDGRLRFAGLMPSVPSPHHLFDISVLCSTSEGLPNSILEAMAAGRPVVATRVGAVADAVLDGETGVLVPPGDERALADALRRLVKDPALRERMGAAARARARAEYSADAAIQALIACYDELCARRTRAA